MSIIFLFNGHLIFTSQSEWAFYLGIGFVILSPIPILMVRRQANKKVMTDDEIKDALKNAGF